MALTPSKSFSLPLTEAIVDGKQMVTQGWQWFFRAIWERLYPLGIESSFVIVNNQVTPADITGMVFNFAGVTQVIVDYLIQRVTTGSGATEVVETGFFILSYRPTTQEWRISLTSTGLPDSSGVTFVITPQPFTATYSHTSGLWSRSAFALINGSAVTLTAGTSLPSGYTAGTIYYVINTTSSTFKLSATVGGSAVTAATDNGTGTLTVTPTHAADGQVQYTSSNMTGTAGISSIFWRARTLGGKNVRFSVMGKR